MNTRRRMTGVVTSDKMQKTVVVEISRTFRHRLYKKVVHARQRVMAHDEMGSQIGDHVQIVESRPLSRHKRWVVEAILRREIAAGQPEIEMLEELKELESLLELEMPEELELHEELETPEELETQGELQTRDETEAEL